MISLGEDLSALDSSGFMPTQKRVSAQVINGLQADLRSGSPFWDDALYANDPVEVSPSGAIKDGHHRLAAALLEGISPDFLRSKIINTIPEENILFPSRSWGKVTVAP